MSGSVRTCCIPYCSTTLADNITLHTFPHPEKERERFMMWVNAVGSDLSKLNHQYIYKYRKICHDHFEERYLTWTKRLSAVAVPTLRIPARLQLKNTAESSRFPWSTETNNFLQTRKESTEQKYSLQKNFIPQDKSPSSNSPTFGTSPLLLNTDSINKKNIKEKAVVPFDHKHVLKLLHDKQFFCDVCHKRFTRLSPQGLHNKHTTVKSEATPVPGASDLTVPFIKQENEVEYFEDETENKDCENEISTNSKDKYTSYDREPSAVANNNLSYYVTIPPAFIQEHEIKVECIKVEVQTKEDYKNESTEPVKNILDETSTEQIEHKNVPKKRRTRDKPYSCVCGQKFTCTTWLNKHKARYNHYKDNSSDIKKEDVRTEVTSAVTSDDNRSLVPPAFMKREIKEEFADNITLHTFPHPEKERERFMMWVNAVGSDLSKLNHQYIYKYRKICHDHFEERYLTWTKRLSAVAVPTLRIPARLQLKNTAESSRFPWSTETNNFLQTRKESTEQKYSLQKNFIPQDKSPSSNSPTFGTSPLLLNTDSINKKNIKEKAVVPFDHKHVLKLLHDKQFFCDVCHKRFTRLSPQGLHNKHTTVKSEATPVPGASDLTVPFIKQENEVEYFEDETENKDCENEISTNSKDKYTSYDREPSAVANNNLSYYVTIPPAFIQEHEIKVECIKVEVQTKEDYKNESTEPVKNILDETSTEQIEHKNVPKKRRTRDKPYSCVCGQKFTCTTWLNKHKARYNHYKDNSSDIKKEDVRTEVTSAVTSDDNRSLVPPAFMKREIKEEYVEVEIEKIITDAE